MIIVRLKGGMGNQMFQYAFGESLAKRLNTEFKMDLSILLDRNKGDFVYRDYDLGIFNIEPKFVIGPEPLRFVNKLKAPIINRLIDKLIKRGMYYVKEKHFHIVKEVLQNPADQTIYEGWWQSEQYFEPVISDIRKQFSFKQAILPVSGTLLENIKGANAVCLNVRRTDFLKVDALNTTNLAYFLNAAEYIGKQVSDPNFFVFSDDIEWCREHIRLDHPVTVVSHDHKGKKFGNYLQLMKACKHFIIPNSTFAWWAAWLNENPSKIVIAPKNWFNDPNFDASDLVPKEWIRL